MAGIVAARRAADSDRSPGDEQARPPGPPPRPHGAARRDRPTWPRRGLATSGTSPGIGRDYVRAQCPGMIGTRSNDPRRLPHPDRGARHPASPGGATCSTSRSSPASSSCRSCPSTCGCSGPTASASTPTTRWATGSPPWSSCALGLAHPPPAVGRARGAGGLDRRGDRSPRSPTWSGSCPGCGCWWPTSILAVIVTVGVVTAGRARA